MKAYLDKLVHRSAKEVTALIIDVFAERIDAERNNGAQLDKNIIESYFFQSLHNIRESILLNEEHVKSIPVRDLGDAVPYNESLDGLTQDLVFRLNQRPIFEAMHFLADLLISWSFLIPESTVDELFLLSSMKLEEKSHKNASEALINWMGRYFDLWN